MNIILTRNFHFGIRCLLINFTYELGRVPLIVQISTLVTKYWIRIEASNYTNTLVGEAASFNIRANTQAVNFTNYILKLCDLGSLNGISLPLESLHNVGTYLKNRLSTYFTIYILSTYFTIYYFAIYIMSDSS